MKKIFILFLLLTIPLFSKTVLDTLDTSGVNQQAGAMDVNFSYSEQFHHSIRNIEIELRKLRALSKINPDLINVINVKSVTDTNEYAIQKEIIAEDKQITRLRNYLANSADEIKVQKIKRALNARSLTPDDIVSVYISNKGGVNLYYYKPK